MTSRNLNKWYALAVESGREQRIRKTVLNRLEKRGVLIQNLMLICPEEEVIARTKKGEKKTLLKMKLPGYILVQCRALDENAIITISRSAGVLEFLGGNDNPTSLQSQEVDHMLGKSDAPEARKALFSPGDTARVIEGPFSDFEVTILEVNEDHSQAQIELKIFGRTTKADIPLHQLAP